LGLSKAKQIPVHEISIKMSINKPVFFSSKFSFMGIFIPYT
jgi:hypothetical protein